ncbi:unnamed protein product [Closterium sp. NIES-54]
MLGVTLGSTAPPCISSPPSLPSPAPPLVTWIACRPPTASAAKRTATLFHGSTSISHMDLCMSLQPWRSRNMRPSRVALNIFVPIISIFIPASLRALVERILAHNPGTRRTLYSPTSLPSAPMNMALPSPRTCTTWPVAAFDGLNLSTKSVLV